MERQPEWHWHWQWHWQQFGRPPLCAASHRASIAGPLCSVRAVYSHSEGASFAGVARSAPRHSAHRLTMGRPATAIPGVFPAPAARRRAVGFSTRCFCSVYPTVFYCKVLYPLLVFARVTLLSARHVPPPSGFSFPTDE